MYVPNARNAPMFRDAGEVQISGHVGLGYDGQIGVAITDHVGVLTNLAFVNSTDIQANDNSIRHSIFEGAVGYYVNSDQLCYEIYGGYGRGKNSTIKATGFFVPQELVKATGRYQRFFIQPAIGSNQHHIFNWAVAARFSLVDFTDFESSDQSVTLNRNPVLFTEPSFIGKLNVGNTGLLASLQFGISLPGHETTYEAEPFFCSLGIGFRFGGSKQE